MTASTARNSQKAVHYLAKAEALGVGFPPLLADAERVANTVSQGVHGRRRTGQGETFWQYRAFQSGDSSSQVDWRRSARSDALFVRETEWEASQTVWTWLDSSASMTYRSVPGLPEKWERGAILTLGLAVLLMQGGEKVGTGDGQASPGCGRAALFRLTEALTAQADDTAKDKGQASLPNLSALAPYGQVILVSDFMAPLDELEAALAGLARQHQHVVLWCIADPAEETMPYHGRVRFAGLEGEGNFLVRKAQAIRSDYRCKREDHFGYLRTLARRQGWLWLDHRTDHAPESALLTAYMAISDNRAARGR